MPSSDFPPKAIFTDNMPFVGSVPMAFFIPDSGDTAKDSERARLIAMIEKYGGMVSTFHECFTFQIEPLRDSLTPNHYFAGEVYSARWIVDSVREGQLLPKEAYLSFENTNEHCMKLSFSKQNVKYTITEAIKIFKIALENKTKSKSATFWLDVERNQTLPKRTADSLRNFWKTVDKEGLQNYMTKALESNTRYCHAHSQIPHVSLVTPPPELHFNLEARLFSDAETAPLQMTHRQQVIQENQSRKGKSKSPMRGHASRPTHRQQTKEKKFNPEDSRTHEKQSANLEKIFNILNFHRAAPNSQVEAQTANILNRAMQDQAQLIEQVNSSGYKLLRKEVITQEEKPVAEDDEEKLVDNYLSEIEKQNLSKKQREETKEVDPSSLDARDAFFTLIAIRMMNISKQYNKPLDELHDMFYQVSCDWERLEFILKQEQQGLRDDVSQATQFEQNEAFVNGVSQCTWTAMEDLGAKDSPENSFYQKVLEKKGEAEMKKRRVFLEIEEAA